MTRRQPRPPRASGLTAGLAALGALTCTGDTSGPDPNAVASVTITPQAGTVDTGDSLALAVVVRNALGDPLPGRLVTWTALDAAIATVSAAGTAHAVWPGTARIVAASEGRADTARLHVAARITSITLHPTLDSLASLGDELTLSLQAFIGNRAHAGGSFAWTLSDSGVAQLTVTGDSGATARLVARANGTTRVSVREARGAADSGIVVVRQRVAMVEVTPSPAMVYRSCPAPLAARPLDSRHNPVAHASVSWGSSDTARAAVDSTGLIANTEAYNTDTHGVLKLTLYEGWYAWEFVPVAGGAFRDSGTGTCH